MNIVQALVHVLVGRFHCETSASSFVHTLELESQLHHRYTRVDAQVTDKRFTCRHSCAQPVPPSHALTGVSPEMYVGQIASSTPAVFSTVSFSARRSRWRRVDTARALKYLRRASFSKLESHGSCDAPFWSCHRLHPLRYVERCLVQVRGIDCSTVRCWSSSSSGTSTTCSAFRCVVLCAASCSCCSAELLLPLLWGLCHLFHICS